MPEKIEIEKYLLESIISDLEKDKSELYAEEINLSFQLQANKQKQEELIGRITELNKILNA